MASKRGGVTMQVTIDVPNAIVAHIQTMAVESGKSQSDVITSALLHYFLSKKSEQGWQQIYGALQEFEPNFVLERESDLPQVRQELI